MSHEARRFIPRESLPPWTEGLLGSIAEHDQTTYLHSVRVGMVSNLLWNTVRPSPISGDMPTVTGRHMLLAGLLHDIKKLDIPSATLTKPDGLTAEELALLSRHPFDGASEIAQYDVKVADIIRGHHRFGKNGVVYPPYDQDPDAQVAMLRPGYGEVEAAQRILAIADKSDTGLNRQNGIHGALIVEEREELRKRFRTELSDKSILPEWLDTALEIAWQIGELQAAA